MSFGSAPRLTKLTTFPSWSLQSIHSNPSGESSRSYSAGRSTIGRVQIAHPPLQPGVHRITRQVPVEAHIVIPLAPLAELVPHEHQLLARDARTCSRTARAGWRTSATRRPGIFDSIDFLRCTTSSCENGRMKRSEYAYIRLNVIWLWWYRRYTGSSRHVLEHVVHPPHVPLEVEAEPPTPSGA